MRRVDWRLHVIAPTLVILLCTSCGPPALIVMNDTPDPVDIDVVARIADRKSALRPLPAGLGYNSKLCAQDVGRLSLNFNGKAVDLVHLKKLCPRGRCGCIIKVSDIQ